jgi:hypothetical protein
VQWHAEMGGCVFFLDSTCGAMLNLKSFPLHFKDVSTFYSIHPFQSFKMSLNVPDSTREQGATGHSMWTFKKKKVGNSSQPDGVHRSRSPFRWFRNQKSPDLENQSSTEVDTSSTSSGSKLADGKEEELGDSNTDMWALADKRLREDPRKRQILEKYDNFLEKQLPAGSKLAPIGTNQRRKQAFEFFNSEIQRLNRPER